MKTLELYDLSHTMASDLLKNCEYPWQALAGIKAFILELGKSLGEDYTEVAPKVWVHKTAKVAPTAYLGAPCIIGAGTEVRHCAFIRGSALVGENCVVGNSTELKNVILFDNVQVPHYNYVGDSILGYKAHMGAGSITSNVRQDFGGGQGRGRDPHRAEEIRRHAGRPCGSGLQQRAESRHRDRQKHQYLSAVVCAGRGAAAEHLENRRHDREKGESKWVNILVPTASGEKPMWY